MVSVGLRSLRWSPVVFDCLRSLRRCLVLSGGLGWSPVVSDGLRWSPVVFDGLRGSP